MEHTNDVLSGLTRMRDEQLVSLVALASDPKKANKHAALEILANIRTLDQSIRDRGASGPYAKYKSAILAIVDYLDALGRAVPPEHIEEELAKGGFRGGTDEARSNIRRSISSFTGKGKLGRRTKQIKEVRGLVGLGKWADDRFHEKLG